MMKVTMELGLEHLERELTTRVLLAMYGSGSFVGGTAAATANPYGEYE